MTEPLPIPWEFGHRFQLINDLAEKISAQTYLEIGCAGNDTFDVVAIPHRVGVDPRAGGTVRMTSDEFFATNTQQFDMIFVDGLHHYDQVTRDIKNGLQVLTKNGIMVIHDMLPKLQQEAETPRAADWSGTWTGDVWRAGFDLMARSDIKFFIVPMDCGCGVVTKNPQISTPVDVENSWTWFVANWHRLPLVSYHDVLQQIS